MLLLPLVSATTLTSSNYISQTTIIASGSNQSSTNYVNYPVFLNIAGNISSASYSTFIGFWFPSNPPVYTPPASLPPGQHGGGGVIYLYDMNISTHPIWFFEKTNKIDVRTYDKAYNLIKVDDIDFEIFDKNIKHNYEIRYLSKGKYRIDVVVENQNITELYFNVTAKDSGKIVTKTLNITFKNFTLWDYTKLQLEESAKKVDRFFTKKRIIIFISAIFILIIISYFFFFFFWKRRKKNE